MKFLSTLSIAAAGAALLVGPAAPAHANIDCGYARTGVRVEAGANTSCPFAINVAQTMMNTGNGGGAGFNAYSPTTGQTYLMTCSIERHGSVTCRGGDNAEVVVY